MRRFFLTLCTASAVPIAACAHVQLAPGAEELRVTSNPEAVRGCAFIASVEGSDQSTLGPGGAQLRSEENANHKMRNAAASAGANIVLLVTSTTTVSGSRQRGEAYKCAAPAPPSK